MKNNRILLLPDGTVLSYEFTRKNIRNLNARVRRDGSIAVSAPNGVSIASVEQFLREKSDFLIRAQNRIAAAHAAPAPAYADGECIPFLGTSTTVFLYPGNKNTARWTDGVLTMTMQHPEDHAARIKLAESALQRAFCARAEILFRQAYALFGSYQFPLPSLSFRRMKSRWGSCSPHTSRITLNTRLWEAREEVVFYVLVHELAHCVYPNHGRAFHELVRTLVPDWQSAEEALKQIRSDQ